MPWRRQDKEGKRPSAVIGTQMAAAVLAEKLHQSRPQEPSPIEGVSYEVARGELDLFRYVESPIDKRIEAVVDGAFGQGAGSVAKLRAALRQSDLYTLLTFSRRRALLALRQESPAPLTSGLRALALVDLERIDWRDAAVATGLLAYAGRRTGAQVQELVTTICARSDPVMAEVLRRHSSVPEEGLAVGGYREIRTSQGVGLANDYGHAYAPTIDLVSIAEKIISFVEADEYRVQDITTGSDLPAVWIPAADTATQRASNNLRGCLSVSARPKTDWHGMPDQMFSVWVAETANPNDSLAIAAAAAPKAGSEIAILGVASGPLCAVMVTRSVVMGVQPLENMESLERFRAPLQDALKPG
jgi:hypothetical protein